MQQPWILRLRSFGSLAMETLAKREMFKILSCVSAKYRDKITCKNNIYCLARPQNKYPSNSFDPHISNNTEITNFLPSQLHPNNHDHKFPETLLTMQGPWKSCTMSNRVKNSISTSWSVDNISQAFIPSCVKKLLLFPGGSWRQLFQTP